MLIHIPLWVVAIITVVYFASRVKSLKASPLLFLTACVGLIILSLVLFRISNLHFYYPNSLISNRWSDFEFWISKCKTLRTSFTRREGRILLYKDIMLMKRMILVLMGSILTVGCHFGCLHFRVSGAVKKL